MSTDRLQALSSKLRNRDIFWQWALPLLVMAAIAFAVELLIFNFASLETMGLQQVFPQNGVGEAQEAVLVADGSAQQETPSGEDVEAEVVFAFPGGCALKTLSLTFVSALGESVASAELQVLVADEGQAVPYVLATVPFAELQKSPVLRIHSYGQVNEVVLRLQDGAATPQAPASVVVRPAFNVAVPWAVSLGRASLIFLLLALAWALRPTSPLYDMSYTTAHALYVVGAIIGIALALSAYGRRAQGEIDPNDQYDALAQAFMGGSLALPYEVDPALTAMENPYDHELRKELGVTFHQDVAFYEGRYYVYFGPLPVLLFFLPWRAVTGQALPMWVPIAICALGVPLALARLVMALLNRWAPRSSLGFALLVYGAALVSSWGLWCGVDTRIYELPEALSLVLVALGLSWWIDATRGEAIALAPALAGSVAMALTMAVRLPWLAYGALGLGLVGFSIRRSGWRTCAGSVLWALAPFAVVGGLLGIYNALRFGSPFDFGSRYNLAIYDMYSYPSDALAGALGFFSYLFQPPLVSLLPPHFGTLDPTQGYTGVLSIAAPKGGAFMLFPVLLFALLIFSRSVRKRLGLELTTIASIALALGAVLAVLVTSAGGFSTHYQFDVAPALVISALLVAIGLLGSGPRTEQHCGGLFDLGLGRRRFSPLGFIFIALLFVGLVFFVALWPFPWHGIEYAI